MRYDDRVSARERGYGTQWEKERAIYLWAHPLCVMCERQGRTTQANVVDHIKPHKGDMVLFWDKDNWQSLCKPHHDATKQAEEARGYSSEIGTDGWPIDAKHPANRAKKS